ncbi:hypothetical protein F5884DRAFT_683783 [Xylogone sp. PMI_703]|nr:hypothetical protein F5884DRAFT_683783 [Xylogone sp. PMI_703]
MATLHFDSELMTSYFSAVPVPPSSHLVNCLDPISRRPMIFALSSDATPKLQVIKEDASGRRVLIDLSKSLNIPDNIPVQAFDVQQSPDLSLYLTFATQANSTQSNVFVVKPFQMSDNLTLSIYPSVTTGTVQKILIGSPTTIAAGYPMVLAIHQPLDRIASGSDISRIFVNPTTNSAKVLADLSLPVNASSILDIAPASSVYGKGLIVLYTMQSTTQLLCEYVRPDPTGNPGDVIWFDSSISCPTGATSIATFVDSRNYSALVISHAQGLQYLMSNETISKNKPGILVSTDPLFKSAQELIISQDSTALSIWASNQSGQLGYSHTTTDAISNLEGVLLLDEGLATSFAASVSRPVAANGNSYSWQSIVSVDNSGNLTLLQQCLDTGIWRNEPFYVASTTSNVPVQCYTITLQAFDSQGMVLTNGTVQVSSSSQATAVLNGSSVTLTTSSSTFQLDAEGELAFIIPTSGVTGQTLTFAKLVDATGQDTGLSPVTVDPTGKVFSVFAGIENGSQLANATTQAGKPLYDGVEPPSSSDLDQAVTCFHTAHDAYLNLSGNSAQQKLASTRHAPIRELEAESIGNELMDGFHWIKSKVDEAEDWVIEKIGSGWQFVCKIGGEAKTWILDKVEKVAEAVTWVWNKIKLGIDKLIEFAGFLFAWDDIIQTKNTISSLLNTGLDYASSQIINAEAKVDQFFDNLKKLAGTPATSPVEQMNANSAPSDQTTLASSHNTSVKWTGERYKNGGASDSSEISGNNPESDQGGNIWVNTVVPALDKVQDDLSSVAQDIRSLFSSHAGLSTGDIFAKIGTDLLATLIDTLRVIVKALMTGLAEVLQLIKDLGNAPINIPIFSALYKDIAGHDLTVIDGISLILAIPATVITKLITGKAPAPFGTTIDAAFFGQLIAGGFSTNAPVQAAAVFPGISSSVLMISVLVSDIQAIKAAVDGGAGGAAGKIDQGKVTQVVGFILAGAGAICSWVSASGKPDAADRVSINYLTAARCLLETLALAVGTKYVPDLKDNPNALQGALVAFELAIAVVQFSMQVSVYEAEIDDTTWKDYYPTGSKLGLSNSVFNFLAVISKFVARMSFAGKQPEIGAVAIAAMNVSATVKQACETARVAEDFKNNRDFQIVAASF